MNYVDSFCLPPPPSFSSHPAILIANPTSHPRIPTRDFDHNFPQSAQPLSDTHPCQQLTSAHAHTYTLKTTNLTMRLTSLPYIHILCSLIYRVHAALVDPLPPLDKVNTSHAVNGVGTFHPPYAWNRITSTDPPPVYSDETQQAVVVPHSDAFFHATGYVTLAPGWCLGLSSTMPSDEPA